MKKSTIAALSLLVLASSCAGTRSTGDKHTAHAESFNFFGLQFPHDDQEMAWSMVPSGAEVHTVGTSPRDWTSVVGALASIFSFTSTQVEWTGSAPIEN